MNLSDKRKLDITFKLLAGRQETTTEKAWYEELAAILFKPHISEIWSSPISSTPPVTDTNYIKVLDKVEMTEDVTVANHMSWYLTDSNSNRITNIIPPRYGSGYTIQLFDNSNIEIPTTFGIAWYFDYTNGVLVFESDPSSLVTLPIKISCYQYIGSIGRVEDDNIEIDGGSAEEVYLVQTQTIDGGNANG